MAVLELNIEIEALFGLIDFDGFERHPLQPAKGNYGRTTT
jgi:hypothetical protein